MRTTPFFKLLLPLVCGILLGQFLFHHNWIVLVSFLLISFLLLLIFKNISYASRRGVLIKSAFLFSHFLCWGLFVAKYHDIEANNTEFERTHQTLTLATVWKKSKNHFKANASTQGHDLFKKGDVLIMMRSDSIPKGLPGDILITKQELKTINPPLNPNQFDYKAYLQAQGIAYSVYLKEGDYHLIQAEQKINPIRLFAQLRIHIINLLDSFPLTAASRAFIKALLLGDKSDLDSEVSAAFSSAGAMHVLAVSGLHVGIIVSIFTRLLSLIKISPSNRSYRWFKTILLVVIIWFFAGITGFSPSIVRASIMFSFLSIGQSLIRHTNIYNSLSMAAFFMLLIDPNNLFSVGFQLSFLAVGGIVFFYDKINKSLYFKNPILRQIWSISSVSIAAQLVTFPLALFYFHQFPIYFLLSNLIVIPAAFLVLLFSIILFALSPFSLPKLIISSILNKSIALLNFLILGLKKLPFTSITDIYIDKFVLLFILLSIIAFSFYILTKKASVFILGICFTILVFSLRLQHKIEQHTKQQLVIYAIPGYHSIDLIQNTKHYLIADSSLWEKEGKLKFACENYLRSKGLKSIALCKKESFGNTVNSVNDSYILSKNHLIVKDLILCINHSSHSNLSIKHIKHRIVLTKDQNDCLLYDTDLYELAILNKPYQVDNRGNKKTSLTIESGPIIHSLFSDGYYSFTSED